MEEETIPILDEAEPMSPPASAMTLGAWCEMTRRALALERTFEEYVAQNETHSWPCSATRVQSALKGRFQITLKSASKSAAASAIRFSVGDMVKLVLGVGESVQEWKGVVSAVHEKYVQVLLDDVSDALFALTSIDAYASSANAGATNSMLSTVPQGNPNSGGGSGNASGQDGAGGDATLRLAKVPNDASYKRMTRTVDRIVMPGRGGSDHPVVQCLYGDRVPETVQSLGSEKERESWNATQWLNPALNDSQREAVQYALWQQDIAVILGPPGTGKTTTLVEIIRQLLLRNQRILVCAGSNIAVDNIIEKLATAKPAIKMVRLGHPARLLESVLPHALDAVVDRSAGAEILGDIRKDMEDNLSRLKKTRSSSERRQLRQDGRALQKELKQREGRVVIDVVKAAQVVVATNTGSDEKNIRMLEQAFARDNINGTGHGFPFDVCILDEAAQSFEASSWIPVLKARRVILAGDHHQLPPTVISASHQVPKDDAFRTLMRKNFDGSLLSGSEISRLGTNLSRTLFSKLFKKFGGAMLQVQYRMHRDIMTFSSREFYDSKLVADASVADRQISDDLAPVVFVDTADGGFQEASDKYDSKYNLGEVQIIAKVCAELIEVHGLAESDIGIIAPYSAQVERIRESVRNYYRGGKKPSGGSGSSSAPSSKTPAKQVPKVKATGRDGKKGKNVPVVQKESAAEELDMGDDEDLGAGFLNVEISTVDGFQGREKDAILISLVRCNDIGDVGFLADKRRLNVAITRARRHLFVVGDANTCSQNAFLKKLIQYWEEVADYRTSSEFAF